MRLAASRVLIAGLLTLATASPGALAATSAPPALQVTPAPQIQIQIDGQAALFAQKPLLLAGRTLLPLRAIFERLGARVEWEGTTQTVTATRGERRIALQIGSERALVDGRPVQLDVAAMIIDSSTYVPVRFVSEALGGYVGWDAQRQIVSISRADESRLGRTRAAIRERWLQAQPRFTGEPFAVRPSFAGGLVTVGGLQGGTGGVDVGGLQQGGTGGAAGGLQSGPAVGFQAGALQPGLLDDGLRMLNFVRYLAYMPDDVTLDASLTRLAQHAAVINAHHGQLSHQPGRPAGMADSFYELALKGSSQSNLGAGYRSPADAIQRGYMDDSDPGNIDRLGHRRWILSPRMGKAGFGWVETADRYGAFDALYVFDESRAVEPDFTHWTWPAAGYFPTSFFGPGQAWSVGVNPQRVQIGDVSVRLTRLSDGQVWRFGSAGADGYFRIERAGYGYTDAIIFRPEGLKQLGAEERYLVQVSGLTERDGAPFPLEYEVTFFQL